MGDKEQNTTKSNTHAIALAVIGVILLVPGILIASVHSAALRGSGVGAIAVIAGIILLVITWLGASRKHAVK
jgi:threonine/homoserine/homoserine lactone efflux protein